MKEEGLGAYVMPTAKIDAALVGSMFGTKHDYMWQKKRIPATEIEAGVSAGRTMAVVTNTFRSGGRKGNPPAHTKVGLTITLKKWPALTSDDSDVKTGLFSTGTTLSGWPPETRATVLRVNEKILIEAFYCQLT